MNNGFSELFQGESDCFIFCSLISKFFPVSLRLITEFSAFFWSPHRSDLWDMEWGNSCIRVFDDSEFRSRARRVTGSFWCVGYQQSSFYLEQEQIFLAAEHFAQRLKQLWVINTSERPVRSIRQPSLNRYSQASHRRNFAELSEASEICWL